MELRLGIFALGALAAEVSAKSAVMDRARQRSLTGINLVVLIAALVIAAVGATIWLSTTDAHAPWARDNLPAHVTTFHAAAGLSTKRAAQPVSNPQQKENDCHFDAA